MWTMLPTLLPFVEQFRDVFTAPSYATHSTVLLGWVMCLGRHTLFRVFLSSSPGELHNFSGPHGQDASYNFFERSAWKPSDLCYRVALLVFTNLSLSGVIKVVVDDTLFHKRGIHVWGKGWFRDAVASTKKRVATASGHNWVVMAVVYEVPLLPIVLALPILARLHLPGKDNPSCAQLAREMMSELMRRFPDRTFLLLGDGGYSNEVMLKDLDGLGKQLDYIGRIRSDSILHDPIVPEQPKSKRGKKPQKGPRLPTPAQVAKQAVPVGKEGAYQWREVKVSAYGVERMLLACAFLAYYPSILGLRLVQVVVVRDPESVMKDCYLLATNFKMGAAEIIRNFSLRWSIEVMFKASKQIMEIQGPQHFCQESVLKVVPWVLAVQTLIGVWYLVAGKNLPEAEELRQHMGEWDTEWSLANMLRVLRRAILKATIEANSRGQAEMRELLGRLMNWVHLAT
jgi:DDE superfamily endonuclease